ncbi:unnamed protein product [Pleuronectes platessa]|uniref:Uncharacterized protein n=1 Tax=Pleuronectes platessa TaxID=8262 RepID=A0A9N7YJ63_PLEPL|nr:unnamed protein product [Pleuronectes platessa]
MLGKDSAASGPGTLVYGSLWLVLLTCCVLPAWSQETRQHFDSAKHHTEEHSITLCAEQSEHRAPCSAESVGEGGFAVRLRDVNKTKRQKQSHASNSRSVFLRGKDTETQLQ